MIVVRCGAEVGLARKPVREWMARRVVSVGPAVPARQALQLMLEQGRRHVLVIQGARLLGLVRQSDLLAPADPRSGPDLGRPVGEIMTRAPLVSTRPEQTLGEAAWAMHSQRVDVLPVLSAGLVVGVLTADDVLRAIPGPAGSRAAVEL